VKFTLGAASWVEVYDNNGKRLYYDLAPAGDNLELSGAGPLQVFLGNAPGVSIELEGQPFDLKPFLRSDNTARFKLGSTAKP
jgi:cytoskeleton protein RodZ